MIEENLGCKIFRTNPDAPDFNIYRLFNQVRMYTKQSVIKSTKKFLTDDLSKRLLELELESNHSIKAKCLKQIVKKNTNYLIKIVQYDKYCFKSKEKPKFVKKKENIYCLVCKKETDNKNIKGVALENEIGQQKSACVDCGSRKSAF